MYKKIKAARTTLKVNESYQAVSLEQKIERMMNNGEPIGDGAAIQYTERKDGVHPLMDVRTDRMELAVEARDKLAKSQLARRDQAIGERTFDTMTDEQKTEFHTKYPENKYSQKTKGQGT